MVKVMAIVKNTERRNALQMKRHRMIPSNLLSLFTIMLSPAMETKASKQYWGTLGGWYLKDPFFEALSLEIQPPPPKASPSAFFNSKSMMAANSDRDGRFSQG